MHIPLKWWNLFWGAVLAAFALFCLMIYFTFREKIITTENPDGGGAHAPYAIKGKGFLLTRLPTRVFLIERSRAGYTDLEDQTYLAQVPMTTRELQQDLAFWMSDPELTFEQFDDADDPDDLPAYWPAWFPRMSSDNYLGTLGTSHGWFLSIYRDPNDDHHVYIIY